MARVRCDEPLAPGQRFAVPAGGGRRVVVGARAAGPDRAGPPPAGRRAAAAAGGRAGAGRAADPRGGGGRRRRGRDRAGGGPVAQHARGRAGRAAPPAGRRPWRAAGGCCPGIDRLAATTRWPVGTGMRTAAPGCAGPARPGGSCPAAAGGERRSGPRAGAGIRGRAIRRRPAGRRSARRSGAPGWAGGSAGRIGSAASGPETVHAGSAVAAAHVLEAAGLGSGVPPGGRPRPPRTTRTRGAARDEWPRPAQATPRPATAATSASTMPSARLSAPDRPPARSDPARRSRLHQGSGPGRLELPLDQPLELALAQPHQLAERARVAGVRAGQHQLQIGALEQRLRAPGRRAARGTAPASSSLWRPAADSRSSRQAAERTRRPRLNSSTRGDRPRPTTPRTSPAPEGGAGRGQRELGVGLAGR